LSCFQASSCCTRESAAETKLKPRQMAGMVEARIDGAAVEFLVPA